MLLCFPPQVVVDCFVMICMIFEFILGFAISFMPSGLYDPLFLFTDIINCLIVWLLGAYSSNNLFDFGYISTVL